MPVACITGAASGIGLETARLLSQAGYSVYGLSTSKSGENFLHETIGDITNAGDVERFISFVIAREGQIDVLVNSAGISIASPVELTLRHDAQRLMEVNFLGLVAMCQAVLPPMRERRCGCIINIASVAGLFPLPYEAFYSSSKSAVIAFSRSLRMEVGRYGIRVIAVAPGGVRTPFTSKRIKYRLPNDAPYTQSLHNMIAHMGTEEQTGLTANRVARRILSAIRTKSASPVIVVGGVYRLYALLNRLLPYGLIDKIIALKYLSK